MASFTQSGRLFGRDREAVAASPEQQHQPRERVRGSTLARAVMAIKRVREDKDYVYALSIASKFEAQQQREDERPSLLNKIVGFVAKRAVFSVGKFLVRTLYRAVIKTAARLMMRSLWFVARQLFSWVVRPLISGIITTLAANPWTALLVVGGAAGYMVWKEFFSDAGKAKRAAEAATMPESEVQPDITGGGAAGVATPEMRRRARESAPQREANDPQPTLEQQTALGKTATLTGKVPSPTTAPKLGTHQLGDTSRGFESNGNPGTVSTGAGDKGGISYGLYQLASNEGSVQAYLKWSSKYGPEFEGLQVNSTAFIDKWKEVAKRDPKGFGEDQHNYAQKVYYDRGMRQAQNVGWDFNSRGPAIHDMIWSTSVQFGGINPIKDALRGQDVNKLTDRQIIELVQNYKHDNVQTQFRSSPKLWDSLRNRALKEKAALLGLDDQWQKRKQEQASGTVSVADQKVTDSAPLIIDKKPPVSPSKGPTGGQEPPTRGAVVEGRTEPVRVGNKLVALK